MLLALLPLLLATADAGPPDPDVAAFVARVNRPVSLTVPGTDRVRVRTNQPYGPGDARHVYDAYLPLDSKRPAPVVLLVHGGVGAEVPFRPKDWGIYRSWGRLLAASGFVAIAFNHRLGFPDPKLEEAHQDVAAMLETITSQAKSLHADPQRIAVVAFSAGGPLLAPFLREPVRGVRCLAGFYPFLDLRSSKLHREFLDPEALLRSSPAAQLRTPTARAMPFFLARAGRDEIPDILPGIDSFVAESLVAGTPLTLFNHPEAPHGFDPDPDPRTREVLVGFLAFLRTHVGQG